MKERWEEKPAKGFINTQRKDYFFFVYAITEI
jgi:hypothetical protein